MRDGYNMTELGEIPEDWKVSNLESHSQFITKGSTPTTYGFEWQEFGVRFLRSECVSSDGFTLSGAMHISEEANDAMERSKIKGGDILMTITGNVGRVCVYPTEYEKGNINQHIARIRIDDLTVSPQFVFQYLSQPSIIKKYLKITTGQAYPQLSLKQVRETKIPLPPIQEQQKIATILSTVDEKIEVVDAQIAQVRELKKGLMQKLLTRGIGHAKFKDSVLGRIPESWEVMRIGDIATLISGLHLGPEEYNQEEIGIPYFTGPSDYSNSINDVYKWTDRQNSIALSGDTLITVKGSGVGGLFYLNLPQVFISRQVMSIRVNTGKCGQFVFQYLTQKGLYFQELAKGNMIPGLSRKDILLTQIPVPPLSEQKKISMILSEIDDKLDVLQNKKEAHQQLKKGLMQQLLTGRVRVIDQTTIKEDLILEP